MPRTKNQRQLQATKRKDDLVSFAPWGAKLDSRPDLKGGAVVTRDAMTKAELVGEVAGMTQLPKKHAEIIVNTVFESIADSLRLGSKIELRGFGSFRIRDRRPRIARNPKTGAKVDVPAKRIPYFKPGKELKLLLNS